MPTVQVTTKKSEQIWATPDGQRVIYKVTLDYQGQELAAKTYSNVIATVGWSGMVESYEKPGSGNRPDETFVKQPPKENPGYPSGGTSQGSKSSGYTPRDDSHIKAQWAIGQANTFFTLETLDMAVVETMANEFFEMVERVKVGNTPEVATDTITPVTEELDMSGIDEVLGKTEPVNIPAAETPWGKK